MLQRITRLAVERRRRGWSQTYLAYHARLTQSQISQYERGRWHIPLRHAERLALVLGITAECLTETVSEEEAGAATA